MSKTRLLLLQVSAFIRISRIFTSESVFLLKVHTRSSRTCKVNKGYSRKKIIEYNNFFFLSIP